MRSAALCRCFCSTRRTGRWQRDRLVVLLLCALPALAVLPAAQVPDDAVADGRPPVRASEAGDVRPGGSPAPAVTPPAGPAGPWHAGPAGAWLTAGAAGDRSNRRGSPDHPDHPDHPGRRRDRPAESPPADPSNSPPAGSSGPLSRSTGAAVAQLYAEAAQATEAYERGRRAAAVQRAKSARFDRLLTGRRRELTLIRSDLGRFARSQYRTGGAGLSYPTQLLLADNPEELLRGHRLARQADTALTRLLNRARRAERELAGGERRARAAWHDLDVRTVRLAAVKRFIGAKLESAQWQLQSEADRSVAAGKCAGAVRIEQPGGRAGDRSWVPPVEKYALSAGFASAGAHWARRHTGQDFAVDIGTPVRSVGEGRVVSVSCGGAFGIEIVVQHPGGYYTQYAHLAGVTVDQGERVHVGRWIGQSGTTGNSTGPHLHFEVRLTPHQGSAVDPVRWLGEHGVRL